MSIIINYVITLRWRHNLEATVDHETTIHRHLQQEPLQGEAPIATAHARNLRQALEPNVTAGKYGGIRTTVNMQTRGRPQSTPTNTHDAVSITNRDSFIIQFLMNTAKQLTSTPMGQARASVHARLHHREASHHRAPPSVRECICFLQSTTDY